MKSRTTYRVFNVWTLTKIPLLLDVLKSVNFSFFAQSLCINKRFLFISLPKFSIWNSNWDVSRLLVWIVLISMCPRLNLVVVRCTNVGSVVCRSLLNVNKFNMAAIHCFTPNLLCCCHYTVYFSFHNFIKKFAQKSYKIISKWTNRDLVCRLWVYKTFKRFLFKLSVQIIRWKVFLISYVCCMLNVRVHNSYVVERVELFSCEINLFLSSFLFNFQNFEKTLNTSPKWIMRIS